MKGRAVFLVFTQMHLALCISYYEKHLKEKGLKAFFVLSKVRFKKFDFSSFPYDFKLIENDFNEFRIWPNSSFKKIFLFKDIEYIIAPLPAHIITLSFFNFAIKNNLKLVTFADGLATGIPFSFRYQLQYKLLLLFRKYFNRIPHLPNFYYKDSYLVSVSQNYIGPKNIFHHASFIDAKNLINDALDYDIIHSIFKLDTSLYEEADILFFTQPIIMNYKDKVDEVFKLIELLGLKTVIKVHPSENINNYVIYETDTIKISKNIAPAELLVNNLRNKKVVSFYSTVSILSKNMDNIWLYPLLEDNKLINRIRINSYNDIRIINNLKQLEKELIK